MGEGRVERPGSTGPSFHRDPGSPEAWQSWEPWRRPMVATPPASWQAPRAVEPGAHAQAAACVDGTAGRSRNRRESREEFCLKTRADRLLQNHIQKHLGDGAEGGWCLQSPQGPAELVVQTRESQFTVNLATLAGGGPGHAPELHTCGWPAAGGSALSRQVEGWDRSEPGEAHSRQEQHLPACVPRRTRAWARLLPTTGLRLPFPLLIAIWFGDSEFGIMRKKTKENPTLTGSFMDLIL